MVGALAWPPVQTMLDGQRIRSAAERVRAVWMEARVAAIESGGVFSFRCTPGAGDYQIQCLTPADEYTLTVTDGPPVSADGSTSSGANMDRNAPRGGRLPEGISFGTPEVASDARATSVDTSGASAGQAPRDAAAPGTSCVLFYPDGTTTTARVRLVSAKGRGIEVSLRGQTGAVLIGEVASEGH